MEQGSREMEHGWTLVSPWHWEMGPLPLVYSHPVFLKDTGLLFSTLWGVWFCLEKNIYIFLQSERGSRSRENLELGVLGPEFYVVPTELAV